MNKDNGKILLRKYLEGTCTEQEKAMVETWLKHQTQSSEWQWKSDEHKKHVKEHIRQSIRQDSFQNQPIEFPNPHRQKKASRKHLKRTLSIAASLVFICLTFYFQQKTNFLQLNTVHESVIDNPKQRVTLTLGGQEPIDLQQAESGTVAKDGTVAINVNPAGKLVYEQSNKGSKKKPLINTLVVPVGEQYQLTLPDGTHVWLNCESSLTFPSYFSEDTRLVELQGEAYFEVAKNKDKPFVIQAKDQRIEVLGTHFNVSAYADEDQTRTSVLEGAVLVTKGQNQLKLTPGRQAVSTKSTAQLEERSMDPYSTVSWKDGYFSFNNQRIESVMNDVSRWYDVEIEIRNSDKKSKNINGTFSRSRSIDELLLYLEKLEVAKFEKEGRRIIVML